MQTAMIQNEMLSNSASHPDPGCLTTFSNFEHYRSTLKIEADEKFSNLFGRPSVKPLNIRYFSKIDVESLLLLKTVKCAFLIGKGRLSGKQVESQGSR